MRYLLASISALAMLAACSGGTEREAERDVAEAEPAGLEISITAVDDACAYSANGEQIAEASELQTIGFGVVEKAIEDAGGIDAIMDMESLPAATILSAPETPYHCVREALAAISASGVPRLTFNTTPPDDEIEASAMTAVETEEQPVPVRILDGSRMAFGEETVDFAEIPRRVQAIYGTSELDAPPPDAEFEGTRWVVSGPPVPIALSVADGIDYGTFLDVIERMSSANPDVIIAYE